MQPDDNTPAFPMNEDPIKPTTPPPASDDPVQPLPQDGAPPFAPPTDIPGDDLPPDHPVTDTNVQPEEVYDEGISGAAEASDPSSNHPTT